MYATVLMKLFPLDDIEPSKLGGVLDRSLQTLTVASREAEKMVSALGKATLRT